MERQPKVEEIVDEEETKNYTKNLIKEDKNVILIELLEEVTWINKPNVATELAIKENDKRKKPMKNWYLKNSMNIWTSLVKKKPTDSLNLDHGTTRSK